MLVESAGGIGGGGLGTPRGSVMGTPRGSVMGGSPRGAGSQSVPRRESSVKAAALREQFYRTDGRSSGAPHSGGPGRRSLMEHRRKAREARGDLAQPSQGSAGAAAADGEETKDKDGAAKGKDGASKDGGAAKQPEKLTGSAAAAKRAADRKKRDLSLTPRVRSVVPKKARIYCLMPRPKYGGASAWG